MNLTPGQKRTIQLQLEEALLRYGDFKAGAKVPELLRAYLTILDEVDAVGAYISGKNAYHTRHEYKALTLFLDGRRIAEVGREMRPSGATFDDVHAWIYGTETRDGLVSAMYAKFVRLNRYCPFCELAEGTGQSKGASYPLTGKTCPHREIEWEEEER